MNDFTPRSYEMTWIIGAACVFLVITAIGMSLVADGSLRFPTSSPPNEEQHVLAAQQNAQLLRLQHEQELLQKKLTDTQDLKTLHDAAVSTASTLEEVVNVLASENGNLLLKLSETQDEIETLTTDFQKIRSENRNILWMRAKDRLLDSEEISNGQRWTNAKISKVDTVGITIQHNAGVSLIPVDQLSQNLRDELDLDPGEARLAMLKIFANDAKGKAARKAAGEAKDAPVPTEAEVLARKNELLAEMKLKAINLHRLAQDSKTEAQRARMMDQRSSSRSVPASLETWAERAGRFDRLGTHYSAQLAAALSKIRELDPAFAIEQR